MEINKFVEERDELEINILKSISGIISGFKNNTGYSPCCISVKMTDVTEIGERINQYIPSDVKCEFNIL